MSLLTFLHARTNLCALDTAMEVLGKEAYAFFSYQNRYARGGW